jgi:hypothetical protein
MPRPPSPKAYRQLPRRLRTPKVRHLINIHANHVGQIIIAWNNLLSACYQVFVALSENGDPNGLNSTQLGILYQVIARNYLLC